jgi:hypothetical protein
MQNPRSCPGVFLIITRLLYATEVELFMPIILFVYEALTINTYTVILVIPSLNLSRKLFGYKKTEFSVHPYDTSPG